MRATGVEMDVWSIAASSFYISLRNVSSLIDQGLNRDRFSLRGPLLSTLLRWHQFMINGT